MAYSSKYRPINRHKYRGDPDNIICRSTWERRFCKFLDTNSAVLRWSSEPFSIKYFSEADNKWRNYWPDFWIEYIDKNGKKVQKIVEIKPLKDSVPPKKRKSQKYLKELKTYITNQCKWKAAKEFCQKNGIEFVVLTEKELGIGKSS